MDRKMENGEILSSHAKSMRVQKLTLIGVSGAHVWMLYVLTHFAALIFLIPTWQGCSARDDKMYKAKKVAAETMLSFVAYVLVVLALVEQ